MGARFVDFGGWEMPLQYQSVLAEHAAVRSRVGLFDVSHLGRFRLTGAGATDLLRRLVCNDVGKIEPGRTQYTMALNDAGGVIDDLIVWRWAEESYWVLPNAANYDRVVARFAAEAGPEIELEPLSERTVMLAVQGPAAPALLEAVLGWAPRRFRTAEGEFGGSQVWAAGTGYTGERGAEVCAAPAAGEALATALVGGGATPCGLGSRDTLRLEAGLALWGQDLDEATTPLEAGLGWVVDWDHEFVGREALLAQQAGGLPKRLEAFTLEDRQIPRHSHLLAAGASTGAVTSGNWSPTLGQGIGMGYLAPPDGESPLSVEIRGRWVEARRTTLPFLSER